VQQELRTKEEVAAMGWATPYIAILREGRVATFRPRGNSMTGRIDSGNLVEVSPMKREPERGDIVLCTVNGNQHLHLISAVRNGRYQISNNHRHVNGWTSRDHIYGVVTSVSA
jgi:hypothetical protein